MPVAVARFVLSQYGSNCYVVRAAEDAAEAVVVDPGGDPAPLLDASRMGRASAAILVTHTDVDHVDGRRRARAGDRRRGLGARRRGRRAARTASPRTGGSVAAYEPEHRRRRRRDRASPGSSSRSSASRATRPTTSRSAPTATIFSGDLLFAGSVGRVDLPAATGRRCSSRCAAFVERYGRDAVVYPGHGGPTTLGRELETNPFLAELRAPAELMAEKFQAPRGTHDVLPAEQPLWQQVTGTLAEVAELYGYRRIQTPNFEDTGALPAHVRPGLGHRPEGDVHVHRPGRPLADAAAGGHGADRARVRRARDAPRPAAGEALHRRADVPVRGAAEGPLPRALAVLGRGDRLGRPGDRRRGDPALHRVRAARRDHAVRAAAQLDRRRGLPAGVRRAADRLARRARRASSTRTRARSARRTRCGSST